MRSQPMKNSPQKKEQAAHIQHTTTQEIHYQGPVPPPAILEKLEKLLPNAANRIFTMAEKDQDAEHAAQLRAHERAMLHEKNQHTENMTALVMAFAVCIICTIGGVTLVLNGFEKIGATLIGATMLGVVGSFLRRKKQ